jgi:hypothetical protein
MDARMLEIEQASVNLEAHQRLDQMRAQMGLPAAPGAGAPALGAATGAQQALGQGQAAGEIGAGRPADAAAPVGHFDYDTAEPEAPEPAGKPGPSSED